MAKKPVADWSKTPIKYLELTTRSSNVLRNSRIETIGQLASMSDENLRHLPGMGAGSLRECRAAVRTFLTERGHMGDVVIALQRAVSEAGVTITPNEVFSAIEALSNDGWEVRRV